MARFSILVSTLAILSNIAHAISSYEIPACAKRAVIVACNAEQCPNNDLQCVCTKPNGLGRLLLDVEQACNPAANSGFSGYASSLCAAVSSTMPHPAPTQSGMTSTQPTATAVPTSEIGSIIMPSSTTSTKKKMTTTTPRVTPIIPIPVTSSIKKSSSASSVPVSSSSSVGSSTTTASAIATTSTTSANAGVRGQSLNVGYLMIFTTIAWMFTNI